MFLMMLIFESAPCFLRYQMFLTSVFQPFHKKGRYYKTILMVYLLSYLLCRHPKNTNIVEGIVKALARVVSSVQVRCQSTSPLFGF